MTKKLTGKASATIRPGDYVLCRALSCSPADPSIANGIAQVPRIGKVYRPGDWVDAAPVEGQGARDLQALANGPIMDPLRLYLPAGKLTEAEYQQRLELQFREAGIAS